MRESEPATEDDFKQEARAVLDYLYAASEAEVVALIDGGPGLPRSRPGGTEPVAPVWRRPGGRWHLYVSADWTQASARCDRHARPREVIVESVVEQVDPEALCRDCQRLAAAGPHPVEARPVPALVRKSVAQILTFWRPGSHDWSWAEEYADLVNDPVTDRVRACIAAEGIGFIDHASPVLLGSDGRVWDGHHRICIAIERDITHLMVEVAVPATVHTQ